MSETVAAQEDRLILPADWAERLLPRRGDERGRAVEPDPEASRKVAELIASRRDDLVAAFEHPDCEPAAGRAALAHLSGAPDPLGAAAVLAVLRFDDHYRGALYDSGGEHAANNRELFAALVADHGLPFAVSAAIEDLALDTSWTTPGTWSPNSLPTVAPGEFGSLKWTVVWSDPEGALRLLRGLIAAADDEEYLRVVAAARETADTVLKLVAAAVLLPAETGWVDAACLARNIQPGYAGIAAVEQAVLAAASSAEHLKSFRFNSLLSHQVRPNLLAELVRNLGPAVLRALVRTLDQRSLDLAQRALVFEAIAMLPSDDAALLVVERVDRPGALAAVKHAAVRYPRRFARAVAARAAATAPADRFRLAGALRQEGVPLDDVLKDLEEADRAAVEALLGEAAPQVADTLPAVLVAPPWAERKRRRAPEPVPGLAAPAGTEIHWAPGQLEAALALDPAFGEWDEDKYWTSDTETGLGLADRLLGRLARGGAAEAPAVLKKLKDAPKYAYALVPVRSAEAAALAADWFARLKSARTHAADWLDFHGEHAVPYLVPCALGADKRLRDGGEAALRHLARRLGDRAVLDQTPDAARPRIEALLNTDGRVPLAGTVKPGAWADPGMLPPVMLRGNETALPAEAVHHLIAALALWTPRLPFPGVDDYAEHCDPASLQRFSLSLFDLWLRAEAPSKDSWAVDQLGAFGDDATVAVLAPHVAEWPGRSQHDRALTGLDVLAHIGTDAAFTALRDIERSFKFPNTASERAREHATRIAEARGLTYEGLADRLLTDHGLTDPDTFIFDYGPRRFHLAFDRLLTPHLTDESGKPRKTLPKPAQRDDAALAKASQARYKALVKNVERTAEEQAERLRSAMLTGRVLTLDDLRVLDAHPIAGVFPRRLVWHSHGTGFRIAEDGGFADVHDREFHPDPAAIRLAHPALLGDDTPAWIALFADYELLQPFDQLSLPGDRFTDEELATGRLTRYDGFQGTFRELGRRVGWTQMHRSGDEPAEWVWRLQQPVPGGWILGDVDPEPARHDPDPATVHTLTNLRLQANRNRRPAHARPLPGSALDPVAAATLLTRLSGHAADPTDQSYE
ncbi:uncharacterized protein DUF4132 [Glycomyces artemisiae]|uniref:Uncharacterized protein DUF4132 n=1 Tax=Glycomyces artemisiae TaxID=1076443 RepID=A0A2T0UKP8_9ACTN|nr:uncharacterized protein DUF4132 [Glycomyces artemisiae]